MSITIDRAKPNFAAPRVDEDLDQLRDNITWLAIAASAGVVMLPGWNTSTSYTGDRLDEIILTEGSGARIRVSFTWTGDLVTGQVWAFDKNLGAGFETLPGGTFVLAYDGNDNFTGATSS